MVFGESKNLCKNISVNDVGTKPDCGIIVANIVKG